MLRIQRGLAHNFFVQFLVGRFLRSLLGLPQDCSQFGRVDTAHWSAAPTVYDCIAGLHHLLVYLELRAKLPSHLL